MQFFYLCTLFRQGKTEKLTVLLAALLPFHPGTVVNPVSDNTETINGFSHGFKEHFISALIAENSLPFSIFLLLQIIQNTARLMGCRLNIINPVSGHLENPVPIQIIPIHIRLKFSSERVIQVNLILFHSRIDSNLLCRKCRINTDALHRSILHDIDPVFPECKIIYILRDDLDFLV